MLYSQSKYHRDRVPHDISQDWVQDFQKDGVLRATPMHTSAPLFNLGTMNDHEAIVEPCLVVSYVLCTLHSSSNYQ